VNSGLNRSVFSRCGGFSLVEAQLIGVFPNVLEMVVCCYRVAYRLSYQREIAFLKIYFFVGLLLLYYDKAIVRK